MPDASFVDYNVQLDLIVDLLGNLTGIYTVLVDLGSILSVAVGILIAIGFLLLFLVGFGGM